MDNFILVGLKHTDTLKSLTIIYFSPFYICRQFMYSIHVFVFTEFLIQIDACI